MGHAVPLVVRSSGNSRIGRQPALSDGFAWGGRGRAMKPHGLSSYRASPTLDLGSANDPRRDPRVGDLLATSSAESATQPDATPIAPPCSCPRWCCSTFWCSSRSRPASATCARPSPKCRPVVLSSDGVVLAEYKRINRQWVTLEEDLAACGGCADRHRGPPLLRAPRHRLPAHRRRPLLAHLVGRPAGRLDHHAAARAQPVSGGDRPRAHPQPQGQGGHHRAEDRGGLHQGRDPRDLSQHRAVPLQRLRHRDGRAHLLRQVRRTSWTCWRAPR